MIAAAFIILVINICWSPVIDALTIGKYGAVNRHTIFILSLSTPFIYLNNFMWTKYFAQGRLKMILHSFLIAVGVNILLDVLLIPIYGNKGAAIAVLVSLAVQFAFFVSQNELKEINRSFYSAGICMLNAVMAYGLTMVLFNGIVVSFIFSATLFSVLLVITGQIKQSDRQQLRLFLKD